MSGCPLTRAKGVAHGAARDTSSFRGGDFPLGKVLALSRGSRSRTLPVSQSATTSGYGSSASTSRNVLFVSRFAQSPSRSARSPAFFVSLVDVRFRAVSAPARKSDIYSDKLVHKNLALVLVSLKKKREKERRRVYWIYWIT